MASLRSTLESNIYWNTHNNDAHNYDEMPLGLGGLEGLKISFIIPAFNEGERIADTIDEVEGVLGRLNADYELIVVDDGSSDNTFDVANGHSSKNVMVYRNGHNVGKGGALLNGIQRANGDYITFLDADLDIAPSNLKIFLEYMERNNADVVIGSKRHPGSKVIYPVSRRFLSRCYSLLIFLLFRLPLRDTQSGFKLFKSDVLKRVYPRILCKRYAFDLELLVNAHHLGYKIVEAPIDLSYRRFNSRISLKDIWNIFVDTCAIFYRLRILKYYDRVTQAK